MKRVDSTASPIPKANRRLPSIKSLQNRNFRIFWLSITTSNAALMMMLVARGWFVYHDLGRSAAGLGAVTFVAGLPLLLLPPLGGIAADRMSKKNLLLITQSLLGIVALVTAVLVATDTAQYWHILVLGGLLGAAYAFYMPAQQALTAELVETKNLFNAISINSAGSNLTAIAGPVIGGALIAVIGVSGVFFLISGLYALIILGLMLLPSTTASPSCQQGNLIRDFREGLSYVKQRRTLQTQLIIAFVTVLFGQHYQTLMPVFAKDVLHRGPGALGGLMAAVGTGGLIGALFMSSLGDFKRKGQLLITTTIGYGMALSLFSFVSHQGNYPLSLVMLAAIGMSSIVATATNQTLLMLHSEQEIRGRVMSLQATMISIHPLTALPAGMVADAIGAPLITGVEGLILIAFATTMIAFSTNLRRS